MWNVHVDPDGATHAWLQLVRQKNRFLKGRIRVKTDLIGHLSTQIAFKATAFEGNIRSDGSC
jgi:hypothetical protein